MRGKVAAAAAAVAMALALAAVKPDLALRCSGAVIGPRLVLTAEHCMVDIDASHFGFRVGTDNIDDKRGHVVPIARVWAPQVRSRAILGAGHDLAVVETKAPLGVPALPLATERPEPGKMVSSYGYGQDDPSETADPKPFLRRLDSAATDGCIQLSDDPEPVCTRAPNGGLTGHGDSGGPLVVVRDGAPQLVGATHGNVGTDLNVYSDVADLRAFVTTPPASAQAPVMTRPVRMMGSARPGETVRCSASFSPKPTSVVVEWLIGGHGQKGTYYDAHGERRPFVDTDEYDSLKPAFRIPRNAGGKSLQCVVNAFSGPYFRLRAVVVVPTLPRIQPTHDRSSR
jgi:Trypsin